MRITQGTFSFLPDLTDEQIATQIAYAQRNGWAVNIDTPTTRIPGIPTGSCGASRCSTSRTRRLCMYELAECRKVFKGRAYIRLVGVRQHLGLGKRPATRSSSIVRKKSRASRWNVRKSMAVRSATRTRAYATDKPAGTTLLRPDSCHGRAGPGHPRLLNATPAPRRA